MATDYAKWDRFEDSDEEDALPRQAPVVTKFEDGAKTVKIGPQGLTLMKEEHGNPSGSSTSSRFKQAGKSAQISPLWNTINGGLTDNYAWSQSREEVTLQWFISSSFIVKAKDVTIVYDEAVRKLLVNLAGQDQTLLSETLLHDVEPNPGTEGEAPFDWELKRKDEEGPNEQKQQQRCFIELTFRKKAPFAGVTLWWASMFVGGPEIDVTAIQGRDQAAAQSSRSVWEEAHRMFQAKVATREKIVLDV